MSDFGDTSGVNSETGYSYQKLVAVYYLVVKNVSEIEYEVDGEDISIINEGPDRDSIEYIQVKHLGTGSFSLSKFKNDVFPQLWAAYITALERHNDKAILSTLITNVSWDDSLRYFCQSCTALRKKGILYSDFEGSLKRYERIYKSMKSGRNTDHLYRFFWGLEVQHSLTLEYAKDKILECMNKSNVREPRTELAKIMHFFSEKKQGRITKRQIEDLIGKNLTPIDKGIIENTSYTQSDIRKSLYALEAIKTEYGTTENFFDRDKLIRDMTLPANRVSKRILYQLDCLKGTSAFSFEEIDETFEIVSSDLNKIKTEANEIADLKCRLWHHQTRYTHAISSMQQTAASYGIDLGSEESES